MSLLDVDHLTHRFSPHTDDRPVLDAVDLHLDNEDIVAVVGESGCGKTTLGRLVVGLARPVDGRVRFDGRDIWSLRGRDLNEYRRSVQLVQQDPYASLNPGLTIEATLGAALLYHRLVNRRQLEPALVELLAQVGLDATPAFLRRYPHQLSGGQRQRVAIARAMSLRPRLVVADEATSMLDVSMRVSILDLLLSFRRQRSLAYIFISHDFGVVRYFAQGGRVVVMFYGVIVEEGPTEEVIRQPKHPYTHLLLQAIPVPNPAVARLRSETETVTSVEAPPARTGCVFSNRCPFVEDRCRQAAPPQAEVTPHHRAACWFPERVPSSTITVTGGTHHVARSGAIAGASGNDLADPGRAHPSGGAR